MSKLLFLGGSVFQVPAISRAKSLGIEVITVDYFPTNPGHKISNQYYNVSTTDKRAVLEIAEKEQVDGVIAYASDPAAPTAAFVAETLGLPGSPLNSIEVLGEKHQWRNFLQKNGFNVPRSFASMHIEDFNLDQWIYPLIVKPVDSSGSKGVSKIHTISEFKAAFDYAKSFSRNQIIIVEEFIDKDGAQIGGDGFFGLDRLEFICLGDQYVNNKVNPFVPAGMMFPSRVDKNVRVRICDEIERALQLLEVKNLSFNIEVMLDKAGRIYLMEIGPRNGGNFIPQAIQYLTGVDLCEIAIRSAIDKDYGFDVQKPDNPDYCVGYYALHSDRVGIFKGVEYNFGECVELLQEEIFLKESSEVEVFNGSNKAIGILLLRFKTEKIMTDFYRQSSNFVELNIV